MAKKITLTREAGDPPRKAKERRRASEDRAAVRSAAPFAVTSDGMRVTRKPAE